MSNQKEMICSAKIEAFEDGVVVEMGLKSPAHGMLMIDAMIDSVSHQFDIPRPTIVTLLALTNGVKEATLFDEIDRAEAESFKQKSAEVWKAERNGRRTN